MLEDGENVERRKLLSAKEEMRDIDFDQEYDISKEEEAVFEDDEEEGDNMIVEEIVKVKK